MTMPEQSEFREGPSHEALVAAWRILLEAARRREELAAAKEEQEDVQVFDAVPQPVAAV
jgi:hypothetical protein